MTTIEVTKLSCGTSLLIQPMPNVASAAMSWMLPVGSAGDPHNRQGEAVMLEEMLYRGAGGMSSRQHSDALDRLGVDRSTHISNYHLLLGAKMLGDRLDEALPLLTAMIRDPALPPEALEPARSLCLQSLEGLHDDPQQLCSIYLKQQHLPEPFNRHGYGHQEALQAITLDELRDAWENRATPEGSIIGIAGAVDPSAVIERLETLLADWNGQTNEPKQTASPHRGATHYQSESNQTHIGLACHAPPASDEQTMLERIAIRILGGASSSRLFSEVREKRGLCYSVSASYRAGRDRGYISLYAGSTPQRAQQTVDVTMNELARLHDGVTEQEFRRATVGLKSRLIMQGESTAARAGAIAGDYFRLGRPRSLDEIAEEIDSITLANLNEYLASRDFGEWTFVSLGSAEVHATVAA